MRLRTRYIIDTLQGDACGLRRSLGGSVDGIPRESTDDILERTEAMLCENLNSLSDTTLSGDNIAQLCLSLAYSGATWATCDDFQKIALLDNIAKHHLSMTAKNAANVLWALARMGCSTTLSGPYDYNLDADTADSLIQTCYQRSDQYTQQTQANLLWAFAVLDFNFSRIAVIWKIIFNSLKQEIERDYPLQKFNGKEIAQIRDFLAYYDECFDPDTVPDIAAILFSLDKRIDAMPKPRSSKSHLNLAAVVKQLTDRPFKLEHPVAGGYADICFTAERVVIEFNGSTHYDKDGQLNTHSKFRQRVMEKCGYRVFHVHYQDWDHAHDKYEFVRHLLHAANLPLKRPAPALTYSLPPLPTVVVATVSLQFFPVPTLPSLPLKRTADSLEDDIAREAERPGKYMRCDIIEDTGS